MLHDVPAPASRELQSTRGTTDAAIDAALMELTAEGRTFNHDEVAARAGLSRRTVYRRFADQESLRRRVWQLLSPPSGLERDEQWLTSSGLIEDFKAFDANESASIVAMSSLEGRAMRNALREQRVAAAERLFGPHLEALPEPRRTHALAVLQLLCSGLAWREMRDQWELGGAQSGEAALWAIRTLLKAAAEADDTAT
jgi:AcrR family transcriptional regulator